MVIALVSADTLGSASASTSSFASIPLSVPHLAGNEWKYVKECLDTGWISSVGAYVDRFERALADFVGARHAIAAVNGTAALHLALLLAGVKRDDCVVVPNLTFVASANAIAYLAAEPIFIDVTPDTWQMDLELLERYLDEQCHLHDGRLIRKADGRRIAAILPVHVLGNLCEMGRLLDLAERYGIPVVEDSTEALGSQYRGRSAGTLGMLGTFSFNGNKIISTGGGGMIVTQEDALAQRAKHLTTTAKAPGHGYFHDEIGYNYRLVNVLAAIGLAQIEQLPGFLDANLVREQHYRRELSGLGDLEFQSITPGVKSNHWLCTVKTRRAPEMITYLQARQIDCRPFWVPMNRLPMYSAFEYVNRADVAGKVYRDCVSIPSSSGLSHDEMVRVCHAVREFFGSKLR